MKNNTITKTINTILTAAAILAAPAISSSALWAQDTPVTYNYTYDANGNLTRDGRTGLEMKRNVLNLLDSAGVHGSSLTYTWLSDGTLIGSTLDDGNGNIIKRHYLGSFVFVEDPVSGEWVRESIGWDEGRIFFDVPFLADSTAVVVDSTATGRGYRDCWYARDHLGNVRAVIDITPGLPAPVVLEQSDYLPFGTRVQNAAHASMPSNRWRYAGKEEQRSGSLDLGLLNFGARMYDPFTARWTAVDPMAGKYGQMSPYSYCGGNPIGISDPDGRDIIIHYLENGKWHSFNYNGQETGIPDNNYVTAVIDAYKYNKSNWEKAGYAGQSPSTQLVEDNNIKVNVYEDYNNPTEYYQDNGGIAFIRWNSTEGLRTNENVVLSPASVLAHEADHAIDDLTNAKAHSDRREDTSCKAYTNAEEKRVITGSEQKTARANGEIKPGQITRKNHLGHTVYTIGPTFTDVFYDTKTKKR